MNRTLLFLFFTAFGTLCLCSCGIKGRPLPPENNVVNINQLPNDVGATAPPSTVESTKKTDSKKTDTKKTKKK